MKNKNKFCNWFDIGVIMLILFSFCYNDIISISVICILSILLIILSLLARGYRLVSFSIVYLILLFIFHCGYSVLWVINYNFSRDYALTLPLIPDDIWVETLRYSIYFIDIIYFIVRKQKSFKKSNRQKLSKFNIKKIGNAFLIIFFIPRVYIDLLFLFVGYENAFNVTISGMVEVFAEGFFVGAMLLLIAYKNDDKRRKNVFILRLLICAIGMLSGRRQEKVVFLLGLLIVYFNGMTLKKHSLKKKIALISVFYISVVLIATIGDLRAETNISFQMMLECFWDNLRLKMILEQIEEFAYASYTLAAIIKTYSPYGTGFGWNYYATFVEILPNVNGVFTPIIDRLSYVQYVPDELYFWLGGSILGETYYNFGWYGLLVAIPLGILVRGISNNINEALTCRRFNIYTIMSVILIGPMLLWNRGSFGYIVRPFTWLLLFAIIINNLSILRKECIRESKLI